MGVEKRCPRALWDARCENCNQFRSSAPHWWGTANPAARVPHTRAARTSRPYPPPGHVSVGFVCEYQPDRAKIDRVRAHGAHESAPGRSIFLPISQKVPRPPSTAPRRRKAVISTCALRAPRDGLKRLRSPCPRAGPPQRVSPTTSSCLGAASLAEEFGRARIRGMHDSGEFHCLGGGRSPDEKVAAERFWHVAAGNRRRAPIAGSAAANAGRTGSLGRRHP